MPVLLLHSKAYPFVLVVEVLLAFIVPNPALLLYVARYDDGLAVFFSKSHTLKGPQPERDAYKKLPGNIRLGGTLISSKKSRRTKFEISPCDTVGRVAAYPSCHSLKRC